MSSSLLHIVLGAVLLGLLVTSIHGFNDKTYFDMAESESQEYGPTVMGEDNRLPCPYAVHGVRPPQGECGDCGFVIVEKRHHYCIPGKSVIKVLRRKPTCNCKTPNHHGHLGSGFYASESKLVPNYEAPATNAQGPSPVAVSGPGSEQVSRMLRTLMNDSNRGSNFGESAGEKSATPQYRKLEASNAPRTFN